MATEHFIAHSSNGGALYPGRLVTVTNVDRTHPVPSFVLGLCDPTGSTGPGAFLVDAVGFADAERVGNTPPPALDGTKLSNAELMAYMGWDERDYTRARDVYGLPSIDALRNERNFLDVIGEPVRLRRLIDAWAEQKRAEAHDLLRLVGDRPTRRT